MVCATNESKSFLLSVFSKATVSKIELSADSQSIIIIKHIKLFYSITLLKYHTYNFICVHSNTPFITISV